MFKSLYFSYIFIVVLIVHDSVSQNTVAITTTTLKSDNTPTLLTPTPPTSGSPVDVTPAPTNSSAPEPKLGAAKTPEDKGTAFFSFPYFGNKNAIGDSCKTSDDCKIKEAFCVDGVCQCSSEYVPSANKRSCLFKARKLLDDCVENVQCESGLNATGVVACISFRCFCALDAYLVNGKKCYKKLVLDNICQSDEECSIPFSSCRQNVCACNDNMEPNEDNTQCVVMESIDAAHTNCTDDHSCSRFGELYRCNEGICECKPGYFFSGTTCTAEKKLGDGCVKSSECQVSFEQRVGRGGPGGRAAAGGLRLCQAGLCSCISGFTPDRVHNVCKSGGSSLLAGFLPSLILIYFSTLLVKGNFMS